MASGVQELPLRAPVTTAFAAISTTVFVVTLFAPGITLPLMLSPSHFLGDSHIWQPLTYAFFPAGLLNWALVAGLVAFFGWHLEPVLGTRRALALYTSVPIASGLAYVLLIKTPAPFAGGAFLATGLGAGFLCWSIVTRRQRRRAIRLFWAFAAFYVLLVLLASPIYLMVPTLIAWILASTISIPPSKRAAA